MTTINIHLTFFDFFDKEYVRIEAGRFARLGTRLCAREHLRACVKWDLVDRDFFHIFQLCAPIFPLPVGEFFSNFW